MRKILLPISLIFISILSGCSSVTTDSKQPLSVTTKTSSGEEVTQADCLLTNEKGSWIVLTPNTVRVNRAAGDLKVECKKTGQPDGTVNAISRLSSKIYGNLIVGGGVGALIDHSTGKAYNYPTVIDVIMGETTTIDRRDEK